MSSSRPCTGYLPNTIAISLRKPCSISYHNITLILRSGLWMRPHRYQGARPSWSVFMNANDKTSSMAAAAVEEGRAMNLTHAYEEMALEKRPQDPHLDGTGLRFKTLDHGGEYPDTMPQAIKLIDAEGRSCIYMPITQNGKVVDSQGFVFDPEDE